MADRPSSRLARPLHGDLGDAYDALVEQLAEHPLDLVLEAALDAMELAAEAPRAEDDRETCRAVVDLIVALAAEQAAREGDHG